MNVRWKVDGGENNLRKGSFGNTHETLSLSQRNDYYKALVFCLSQGWRLLFEVRSILHFSVASTLRQGFYGLQKTAVSSRSSRWDVSRGPSSARNVPCGERTRGNGYFRRLRNGVKNIPYQGIGTV